MPYMSSKNKLGSILKLQNRSKCKETKVKHYLISIWLTTLRKRIT